MKKQLTHAEVIALLRRKIKERGLQKDFAASVGISAQYLSDILRGKREPAEAILDALGLQKVIVYTEKEAKK